MAHSSLKSPERIAVAAALARLATSPKDTSTSEPVKYRVKVTKVPHVDPGVAVYGHAGQKNEQSDPGVGPVPDCKGKGKARADCTDGVDSQKTTSLYRLKLLRRGDCV